MDNTYDVIDSALYDRINNRQPDATVPTGLPEGEAHTLHIHYIDNLTVIETLGEFQNAEPTFTIGRIAPSQILADYLTNFE